MTEIDEKTTEIKKTEFENNIKVGMFQLQSKSFWITLVSILLLFLLGEFWIMVYFNMNIIKILNAQNNNLIKVIQDNKK